MLKSVAHGQCGNLYDGNKSEIGEQNNNAIPLTLCATLNVRRNEATGYEPDYVTRPLKTPVHLRCYGNIDS